MVCYYSLQSLDVLPSWICRLALCFSSKGQRVPGPSSPFKKPSLISYLSVNPTKQRVYHADTIFLFTSAEGSATWGQFSINVCSNIHALIYFLLAGPYLGVLNGLDRFYPLQFIPLLHVRSWFIVLKDYRLHSRTYTSIKGKQGVENIISSEMLLTSQQETRCCHYSDQLLRLSGRKHNKFNTIPNSFMVCAPQEIFFGRWNKEERDGWGMWNVGK